ncbi:putative polypeptide N-acetylgalactosaminyltransferase 10-like, partial [Scophthalmus maximus]
EDLMVHLWYLHYYACRRFDKSPKQTANEWSPGGVQAEFRWSPGGVQVESSGVQAESWWSTGGVQVESRWSTGGVQAESRWSPGGVQVEYRRSPGGVQAEFRWSPGGVQVEYRRSPGGVQVESWWSPGGVKWSTGGVLVGSWWSPEHLKAPLDDYMSRVPKVQILRTKKREGLIRTRLLGAGAARGEVITFLDSHCEANVNWLPPLLDRIAQNRKTIVCPMIDVIDHDNFGYETQAGDAMRGAFDWEMYYKRIPIPPELQRDDHSEPFESPVMAGGLFAVDRKWFWELGGYDTGLEIWGGEQYEISFKVWMCGGRMEDIPCSRVGHIYRKYVPYKVPGGISLAKNLKRVAEVWMDEYAEYVYQRRPEYRHLSAGDMTAQKELRSRLNCKNFKWFMSEVAWDLPKHYPPVEPPAAAWGEIRNVGSNMCMEIKHFVSGSPIRLESCVKGRGEVGWSHGQVLTFGWREDIRVGDPMHTRKLCFDAISHNSPVTLYDCHGMKGNQLWRYRKDQSLYHPVSNSCVDSSASERRVFMNTCDPASSSQRWMFERTNATVLENFNQDNN